MEDKDIIKCLFERAQDISNFRTTDEELINYSNIIAKMDEKLDDFISQKIPICLKRPLEKLIEEREGSYYDYYDREIFLYYKTGFSDAMNLILSNFIPNNNCSI